MLDQELHYLLMVGYNLGSRAITSRIADTGLLPGQPKILEYLMEHDGCTQKEISEGCGLDKSTIAILLPKLDKAGLIRRESCSTDRRFFHVYLTAEGKRWVHRYGKSALPGTKRYGEIFRLLKGKHFWTL